MIKIFKNNFFWGIALSILLIVWLVSVTSWKTTIKTQPRVPEHEAWLHSLFLSGQDGSWLRISTGSKNLDILNWLIIWGWHKKIYGEPSLVVIGWWYGSEIRKSNGWIGWWNGNKMDWENWAIGWWNGNKIERENWTIGWWNGNKIEWENWTIGWWKWNSANDSRAVILWGFGNAGWNDSLVLWSGAEWPENSFVWNAKTSVPGSARIDAANWVLIWTKSAISGVKLVTSGTVKVWTGLNPQRWAIMLRSGLIELYDGSSYHILGLITGSSLWDDSCGCWFGWVKLEVWDIVKFYSKNYATNCESIAFTGQCLIDWWDHAGYPYCYEISSDVRLHASSWNGRGERPSGLITPGGKEKEQQNPFEVMRSAD